MKLIFLFLLIGIYLTLPAEIMVIHLSNGNSVEFNTSQIEEITFSSNLSSDDFQYIISKIPIRFLKNYPNPFNPKTTISFSLENEGKTVVEIFNLKGQKVKTIVKKVLKSGKHSFVWNGTNDTGKKVSSGSYLYRVTVNGKQKTKKMILLK